MSDQYLQNIYWGLSEAESDDASAGSVTETKAPIGVPLVISIVPPARSQIALQMESPNPVPPLFRLRDGSPR
jgi:hypothetical protein